MQKREVQEIVLEKEAMSLEAVLAATDAKPVRRRRQTKPACPEGYVTLKAGVVRLVRVNRDYIESPDDEKPYIVIEDDVEFYYMDVIFSKAPMFKCGTKEEAMGCGYGTAGYVRLETDGALYVK